MLTHSVNNDDFQRYDFQVLNVKIENPGKEVHKIDNKISIVYAAGELLAHGLF